MKDIKPYDPSAPRTKYTPAQKRVTRYLYETEGLGAAEIEAKSGVHRNIIYRWAKKFNWEQGRHLAIIEKTELQARLEKAEQLGIGEIDQILKAKELMEAQQSVQTVAQTPEGKSVTVSELVPDFRVQNEGLKRAMELTGTKIERKEIEHKGKQEIVHRYEMPEKKPLK